MAFHNIPLPVLFFHYFSFFATLSLPTSAFILYEFHYSLFYSLFMMSSSLYDSFLISWPVHTPLSIHICIHIILNLDYTWHVRETVCGICLPFLVWSAALNIMVSSLIWFFETVLISFFFMVAGNFIVCFYHIFPSIHLINSQIESDLTIVNSAVISRDA